MVPANCLICGKFYYNEADHFTKFHPDVKRKDWHKYVGRGRSKSKSKERKAPAKVKQLPLISEKGI